MHRRILSLELDSRAVRIVEVRGGPERVVRSTVRASRDSFTPTRYGVTKLLSFVGATAGGWVGWAMGAWAGVFTAFVLSMVGTAAGVYVGRRIGRSYEA
jgi:hypothetical protein